MVFGGHLIFARSIQPGSKSKSVRSPRVAEFETIRLFLRPSLDETIGPAILHRNIYTFTLGSRGLVFVLGENGLAAHFFQLFASHIFPQLGSVWSCHVFVQSAERAIEGASAGRCASFKASSFFFL